MHIIPTFHCGGRCGDVIDLYQKAFDLVIDWQGRDEQTGLIYHTEAHIGDQRLRLSDGGSQGGRIQADALFLAVTFDTAEQAQRAFDFLREGGEVVQAPHAPEFAAYMCEVRDPFGYRWFLMVDR